MKTIDKPSDHDLDALRRALLWGVGHQQRNPQIVVFPDPMPEEGSAAWLRLAERLVSNAQSFHLGLKPWQSPPLDVELTDCAGSEDEARLVQTMHDLNVSIYEPDPPTAIAAAIERRDVARLRRQVKGK
jgi:hypothetical protein